MLLQGIIILWMIFSHMFDDAIHAIYRREPQFESSVSGNYEGTFIEVYCEEV